MVPGNNCNKQETVSCTDAYIDLEHLSVLDCRRLLERKFYLVYMYKKFGHFFTNGKQYLILVL